MVKRLNTQNLFILLLCLLISVSTFFVFLRLYYPAFKTSIDLSFSQTHEFLEANNWLSVIEEDKRAVFRSRCFMLNEQGCRKAFNQTFNYYLKAYLSAYWQNLPLHAKFILTLGCLSFFLALILLASLNRKTPLYNAKFAKPYNLRPFLLRQPFNNSIPLAKLKGRTLGLRADAAGQGRTPHILFTAANGTGKTAHLISVLLSWQRPAIVVDIKGELREKTSGYRQTLGPVYTLGPISKGQRFDPVGFLLKYDPNAKRTIASFIANDPQERSNFFNSQAENALLAALRASELSGEAFFPLIHQLMLKGSRGFVEGLQSYNDSQVDEYLHAFLGKDSRDFSSRDYDQIQGPVFSVWQTLNERLKAYRQPDMLELFSANDLSLHDLLNPSTLYLTWPQHYLRSDADPLALILHTLITVMDIYADARGPLPNRMLFALDEAAQYHVPALPAHIASMQGRGMSTLIYVQSSKQLESSYGYSDATTLKDNCGVEVYYQPQFHDAKALSERLGQVTLKGERKSRQRQKRTYTEADLSRPLMTADELTKLKDHQALVFIKGYWPALTKKLLYFKISSLRRRANNAAARLKAYSELPIKERPEKQTKPKDKARVFIGFKDNDLAA